MRITKIQLKKLAERFRKLADELKDDNDDSNLIELCERLSKEYSLDGAKWIKNEFSWMGEVRYREKWGKAYHLISAMNMYMTKQIVKETKMKVLVYSSKDMDVGDMETMQVEGFDMVADVNPTTDVIITKDNIDAYIDDDGDWWYWYTDTDIRRAKHGIPNLEEGKAIKSAMELIK